MPTLTALETALFKLKNEERAKHSQGFFKTGPGEYAEGDLFLGITVPAQRKIAKQFSDCSIADL